MPIVSLDHPRVMRAIGSRLQLSDLDGRGRILIRDARVLLPGGRVTDALLIDGDRIAAAGEAAKTEAVRARGDRAAEMTAPSGAGVRELSLPGVTVLPGFIDAHTHLVHMGFGFSRLQLEGAPSAGAVLERVRTALADHDAERPLIGERWDDSTWTAGDRLERADLDRLAPSTPIVLRRVCGHKAVVNGAAISRLSRHPAAVGLAAAGLIDAASGTLLEDAAMRLSELFPPDSNEVAAALAAALAHAARLGVTGAHDIVTPAALRAQQEQRRSGRLTLRITAHIDIAHLDALDAIGLESGLGDPGLRLGGVKLFLDGSLGARTAALSSPYADRPGERGLLLIDEKRLTALVERIDGLGLTAVIHAIGDCAIAEALSALESLGPAAVRAHRHRIEHFELTPDPLIERMARIGATASMQPNFVARWGGVDGMYSAALGRARLREMNRFRTLADHGVPLAFGSDVMPMGPLAGMTGAVNHPVAEERLTPLSAIEAYSSGSARAAFAETETGTIETGKLADLTLLQGDPLSDLESCKVVATIIGGRCVYSNESPLAAGESH